MRLRAVVLGGLITCGGCAVGVGNVAPASPAGYAPASRVAESVSSMAKLPAMHGLGAAKILRQHAVARSRAAVNLGAKPSTAHSQGKTLSAHVQRAGSSAFTYVVSDGKIRAFDARGHLQATPGGFPHLLSPVDIAYGPHNKLLYVLDVVTQEVHAYDLAGRERVFPSGFAGLSTGTSLAYDAGRDVLCVGQEDAHMHSTPRCYDSGGKTQMAPATMPAKPSTAGAAKTFAGVDRIDALVLVTP